MSRMNKNKMSYFAIVIAAMSMLLAGCGNDISSTQAAQSDSATFVISECVASESGSSN